MGLVARQRRSRVAAMVRGLLVLGMLALAACGEAEAPPAAEPAPIAERSERVLTYDAYPDMQVDPEGSYTAVVTTNLGQMTFALLPAEAPLAVNNFVVLARNGYYHGVIFHRLIPRFMAQSGDPTGLGTGGPGYSFAIEPPQRPYVRGSLAMANTGRPNSNGSQFFICFDDLTALGRLSPDYSLFGQMTEGEDTLAKIEAVPVGVSGTGERSKPQETITITSIEIRED